MYLGLDTSCYTTSLAVTDAQGRLLCDERQILAVASGERGLRQSDGVFQHLKNLPELFARARGKVDLTQIQGVAASVRPRPVDGSYMPVFTAGAAFGRSAAAVLGVPFLPLSHQEGHILAGCWSAAVDWHVFYAVHMSGGTTEVLAADVTGLPRISELGGSADLHAGQFIDRVGVRLGLPFPAGPHLEKLAEQAGGEGLDIPVSVRGLELSFSGPESHVQRMLAGGDTDAPSVARGVERCVAESLRRLVRNTEKTYGAKPVLFVGGVAANRYIRRYLESAFPGKVAFAEPCYAGDNAVGPALFAQKFTKEVGKLQNFTLF